MDEKETKFYKFALHNGRGQDKMVPEETIHSLPNVPERDVFKFKLSLHGLQAFYIS